MRTTNRFTGLATSRHTYRLVAGLPAVVAGGAWTIPPPVRSFTGRADQLAAVRDQLAGNGAATLVPAAALSGMGGVGKTQLALAYAQRHRDAYGLGWWVPAETELGMLAALAELGVALGLPAALPAAELAAQARAVLGERSGWLLVFDGATDPDAVAAFLPRAGGGHVLVTSRHSAWQGVGDAVPVDLLQPDEAIELLGRRPGDPDERAAAPLAEALGRLPLALDQAAAHAARQRLEPTAYLEQFEQRRAELLARGKPLAYDGAVVAAVTLTLDQLRGTDPAALWVVELCALLAPEEIPLALLLGDARLLPEQLAAAVADPERRGAMVEDLCQRGLLTHGVADTVRMHRLVQEATLVRLADADHLLRTTEATWLLAELFPYQGSEPGSWPRCAQLLAHAQAVLDRAMSLGLTSPALAGLLARTGVYLRDRGLSVRLAKQLHEQALAMRQRLYEGDHPDVADGLGNLAFDLTELGEYERARDLHEQALAMDQRLSEGDDRHVADGLNNLAYAVRILGGFERARELDEQALAMYQRLYQGDHSYVAASLTNLAIDVRELGEFERALDLNEQALAMRQRLYEGDHLDLAASLSNLAIDVRELGEFERALDLNEQALAMYRRLHQGDHPHVAASLTNLAIDLTELGRYGQALELNEQALAMRQRLYKGDHPDVAASLNNLAIDLRRMGEHERALELNVQALAMRQRLHKGDHPDVATSLNNLAIDMTELGKYERALQLDEQALAMRQRLFQGDHPAVAQSLANLAVDLQELGQDAQALALDEQARAMRQRLGEP
ncbi:MAG TPA: FxSxx-COOH system tetratricopeptide repeat protein [Actinomycetes bacterium]